MCARARVCVCVVVVVVVLFVQTDVERPSEHDCYVRVLELLRGDGFWCY